jgi:hypothetical protein
MTNRKLTNHEIDLFRVLNFTVNYEMVRIWKEMILIFLRCISASKQFPWETEGCNGTSIIFACLLSENVTQGIPHIK